MKIKFRFIKTTLSILLFLFATEFGIRYLGIYETTSEKAGNGFHSLFKVTNQGCHFTHSPNDTFLISQSEFSYPHIIDKYGFRNNSSDSESYKVLAFGDSFTEGLGSSQDSTWPALLSKKLNTPVYNAGIMGSDPFYSYRILKDKYLPFSPQRVIILVNWSDIADVIVRGGIERFIPNNKVEYLKEPWFMPLYQYSHTFRMILHIVFQYDYMFTSPSSRDLIISNSMERIAAILNKINLICKERNSTLTVFIHPVPQEYYQTLDSRLNFTRIDELLPLLKKQGVDVVNLRSGLTKSFKTPQEWKLGSWKKDGHFNGKGYSHLASLIADSLSKRTTKVW